MFDNAASLPGIRRFDPPLRVWVDLRALLPRPREVPFTGQPGLFVRGDAAGWLYALYPRADGGQLAWVTYPVSSADGQLTCWVRHFVPAQLLRRRTLRGTRRN